MSEDKRPIFATMKAQLAKDINDGSETTKGNDLICEGNHYFDPENCGIGFHGDAERRKVICVCLGTSTTIVWQWYKNSKPIENSRTEIKLNHGDMYIMSEKAVGYDWRSRNFHTLRHSAGCNKYTK